MPPEESQVGTYTNKVPAYEGAMMSTGVQARCALRKGAWYEDDVVNLSTAALGVTNQIPGSDATGDYNWLIMGSQILPKSPPAILRVLLAQRDGPPILLGGAHDALSAKLTEEAGFDGIWASGFGISAVQAVPDANILSMTETIDAMAAMTAAVPEMPVLADVDGGFGNAINVIRTVQRCERAGLAGVCLEDNIFPKRCSFYDSVQRALVPIDEHVGKIRAAVATRKDPDFVVVARTEALIVGAGIEEALRRARAYRDAGADALLVHSKQSNFGELREFAERWFTIGQDKESDGQTQHCPLIAVPTTYGMTSAEELADAGFRVIIFANQALRAAVRGMRQVLADLKRELRPAAVEGCITTLPEMYKLVGVPELVANEAEFLPTTGT
ncbi:phosphonate [Aspergillus tubingensis]|nr:phosphonate [Aspergillus tubingensis]